MTAGGPRGRDISRVPSKPVEREDDGRYAIHLWLRQDGRFDGDVALRLTPAEAESLHAQLCYALGGHPVTRAAPTTSPFGPTPECRQPTLGSQGVRWP